MPTDRINIQAGLFKAFAYESITVDNTVKSLTLATFTESDGVFAKRAIITVEDSQIRYRYDGVDPTSSEGHLMNPNGVIIVFGTSNIKNFRTTRKGSTNGVLKITYEV